MKTLVVSDTVDLWEAWIDLQGAAEEFTLYVVGDVYADSRSASPVLQKKQVQGAPPSHLFLEILPGVAEKQGYVAEVAFAEPVTDIYQYQEVFICAGEDIIARISHIELLH
jgi:hypothetical protein